MDKPFSGTYTENEAELELRLAKASHQYWVDHKRKMGCHGPHDPCTLPEHLAHARYACEMGAIRCAWFYPCMCPWDEMEDFFKQYNLGLAKTFLATLDLACKDAFGE